MGAANARRGLTPAGSPVHRTAHCSTALGETSPGAPPGGSSHCRAERHRVAAGGRSEGGQEDSTCGRGRTRSSTVGGSPLVTSGLLGAAADILEELGPGGSANSTSKLSSQTAGGPSSSFSRLRVPSRGMAARGAALGVPLAALAASRGAPATGWRPPSTAPPQASPRGSGLAAGRRGRGDAGRTGAGTRGARARGGPGRRLRPALARGQRMGARRCPESLQQGALLQAPGGGGVGWEKQGEGGWGGRGSARTLPPLLNTMFKRRRGTSRSHGARAARPPGPRSPWT